MELTTPMMQQYKKIKQEHKDTILFFRLGDFYEMFENDARVASNILGITLTKRNGIPMCGIPYHAAQGYLARLIKAGKKIAICEQTHIPKPGKGIARREVVEILTPGTIVDDSLLDNKNNNYLVSIAGSKDCLSLAYLDLSTAEFYATSSAFSQREERLRQELFRLMPREILVQESLLKHDEIIARLLNERDELVINTFPDWSYDLATNRTRLLKQFGVTNLKAFGLKEDAPEITSAGILLEYVEDTSKSILPHIRNLYVYAEENFVLLDESTQKNLELIHNLQDGGKRYTLVEVLDHTRTAMGARKLKRWILNPLLDLEQIKQRQDAVEYFYKNQFVLSQIREYLGKTLDLERLCSKVAMDRANAKDLLAVEISLEQIIELRNLIIENEALKQLNVTLDKNYKIITDLKTHIDQAICEDPSIQLNEGNLIKKGYNKELDKLKGIKENAHSILDQYLIREKEKTGITSLKIKYNRIMGYFLEVTKTNLHLVPKYFVKRQTLKNVERYTTELLMQRETEINTALEKIIELEKELFLLVREQVKKVISCLYEVASVVAKVDVLQSFSYAATIHGYTRPQVNTNKNIRIEDGRHPVVEAHLAAGSFIPNSISLNMETASFILLTGPNMAGKSTFLRQTALIVLMAQIGSFVPATTAKIGMVDKIFCRVGATDNLARGESTFLVEMNETAHILRGATDSSLVIMDEVGRGTSTNDGLAIAWAVTLFILEKIKAKTLFATHYHELTIMKHKNLKNYSLEVTKSGGEIIFLKRVKPGAADSSYGIYVAKLAGLPLEVIQTAYNILNQITKNEEKKQITENTIKKQVSKQSFLFSPPDLILEQIKGIKVDKTTPLEALNLIARWKDELSADK